MVNQAASFTFCCDVMCGAPHIKVNSFKAELFHPVTHLFTVLRFVSPNMCVNWLFIFSKSKSPTDTFFAIRMAIAFCICKFCEKDVWSSGFADDVAKNDVCNIFHWC